MLRRSARAVGGLPEEPAFRTLKDPVLRAESLRNQLEYAREMSQVSQSKRAHRQG